MDEKTLSNKIWKTLGMMKEHRDDFIYFDPTEFSADQVHIMTVDTVNYTVQEPRTDPSTKWYDHKSHSAGLKYEMALPLCLERVSSHSLLCCQSNFFLTKSATSQLAFGLVVPFQLETWQ